MPDHSSDFVERVALALVAREHSYSSDPAYWKAILDVTPNYSQQAIAAVDALGLKQIGFVQFTDETHSDWWWMDNTEQATPGFDTAPLFIPRAALSGS